MGESPSAKAPLKFPTPLSLGYFLWALHKIGTRFCSRCPWQSCTPGLVISNTGPECGWAPENKNSHGSIILIFCACLWHVYICMWSHTSVALWASGGCSSSQDTLWSSLINYWQCTCHNPSTCAGSFPWAWKIQAKNYWFPLLISLMTFPLFPVEVEFSLGITLSEAEVATVHIKIRSCVLMTCSVGAKIWF